MTTFNHQLRRARPEEKVGYGGSPELTCAIRNCNEPVEWIAKYDYVTGRAGRITTARKRRCEKHAAAFEKKYLYME